MPENNQFPTTRKEHPRLKTSYRRVKVWEVHSTIGTFTIYAVNAQGVRNEFARIKPSTTIISINRIR